MEKRHQPRRKSSRRSLPAVPFWYLRGQPGTGRRNPPSAIRGTQSLAIAAKNQSWAPKAEFSVNGPRWSPSWFTIRTRLRDDPALTCRRGQLSRATWAFATVRRDRDPGRGWKHPLVAREVIFNFA